MPDHWNGSISAEDGAMPKTDAIWSVLAVNVGLIMGQSFREGRMICRHRGSSALDKQRLP